MNPRRVIGLPRDSTRTASTLRYLPQLDGVRALAVLAVMARHAEMPFVSGGGIGVDVFFVLSGYLITTLLLREFDLNGNISLPHFYIRRVRRLLPALVAVAVISFVLFSIVRPDETEDTLLGIGASLLYISAWFRAFEVSDLGWFGHTWSLSVEEHFYLVWPPVVLWLCRRHRAHLKQWVLGLFVLFLAYRTAFGAFGASSARLEDSPDMRAAQLLAGCALAVVLLGLDAGRARRWDRWWLVLVALSAADLARMVVAPFRFGDSWYRIAAPGTIALETAVILGYLVVHERSRLTAFLSKPALVWVGRRSYAMYLWHLPLFGLLSLKGQPTVYRAGGRGIALILTFVAAWASFKWVESPFYRRGVEEKPPADGDGEAAAPGSQGGFDGPVDRPSGRARS